MTEPRDVEVIEVGPIAPSYGGVTYQITLESGAIVTSPFGFPQDERPNVLSAIVTADGRVLALPAPKESLAENPASSADYFGAFA